MNFDAAGHSGLVGRVGRALLLALAVSSCAEGFGVDQGLYPSVGDPAPPGAAAPSVGGGDQCLLGSQEACSCGDGASGLANCLSSGTFGSCSCSATTGDLTASGAGLSGGIAGTTAATGGPAGGACPAGASMMDGCCRYCATFCMCI